MWGEKRLICLGINRLNSENINFKKSNSYQAFWLVIGSMSSFGLAIASTAILSRYLGKTEYGTYRQLVYLYSTLLVVFTAGLPRVYGYFLPRYSISQGKSIVWRISKLLFLAGVIFSASLFIFSDFLGATLGNTQLSYGIKVFSPIPMFLLPTLGLEGVYASYKLTVYTAFYNVFSRVIMLFFMVLPVVFIKSYYIYAIYGWLISSVIAFLCSLYFYQIPFKNIVKEQVDLKYREIFGYSLPLVFASLWGVAIKASDQFYISRFFGVKTFAEFTNGFLEIPFVIMLTSSVSAVLMPVLSKMLHDNSSKKELIKIWRNVLIKSAYIIYPIVMFCMFNSINIITLLYSKEYTGSVVYFQTGMCLNFFNIIVFAPLILAMGETRYYMYIHAIIAILSWFGGWVIITFFKFPVMIALYSVSLSVIKIITLFIFVSLKLKLKLTDLFPYLIVLKILIHTAIILFMMLFVNKHLPIPFSYGVTGIIFQLIVYYITMIISSNLFNLNYLYFLKPFICRGLSLVKNRN